MTSNHGIVPKSPTITQKQCFKVIVEKFKNNNYKILDYKLIALKSKNGFLGDHRKLLITVQNESTNNKRVHCFAKFLPENQTQIDFIINCGVFKKEVFIYEELFPKILNFGIDFLLQCVPECYLTEENNILIFEDVTNRDFKPISKFDHFNYDQVIVTLKAIAKLHASSLILEEKLSEKMKKKYRLLDDYLDYFYETFYVNDPNHKGGQGVGAALKGLYTGFTLFPEENFDLSDENFKSKVDKICYDIFELVKPSKKYRNVICHGDLWATNIMIKYENHKPIESLLLDFQTARYCPPGHDFMSFLHLTTTRELRTKYFTYFQQFYYEELEKLLQVHGYELKTIIPYNEFVDSCKEHEPFAIIQTVTYCQLTQATDSWIQEYAKNPKLWAEALHEDRSQMVKENCEQNPHYKEVLKNGLMEIKRYCNQIE